MTLRLLCYPALLCRFPFGSFSSYRKEGDPKIRNTASYSKQYLEGRYGADPHLTSIPNQPDSE